MDSPLHEEEGVVPPQQQGSSDWDTKPPCPCRRVAATGAGAVPYLGLVALAVHSVLRAGSGGGAPVQVQLHSLVLLAVAARHGQGCGQSQHDCRE